MCFSKINKKVEKDDYQVKYIYNYLNLDRKNIVFRAPKTNSNWQRKYFY